LQAVDFLWEKRIYKIKIDPFLESDVQEIFINEKNNIFSLDLETKEVKKIEYKKK